MSLTRRAALAGAIGLAAAPALAAPKRVVKIPRDWLPTEIAVNPALPAGQIHVRIAENRLYWTLGEGRAIRYVVALGAAGRNFSGSAVVARKAEWPSWMPTANMIRQEPEVYGRFAGGLPGGHAMNPLGSRALYLYRGGRDTYYRIHGTPQPWTMGRKFSSGCVRLINEHAEHLYDRVPVGTVVTVA
ncbi:L,D-transpeptidase [Limimaricola pyoseonensis]|uniref:Lipoprotein-anchoring transpeptidase ErfK/SrfK n=1 Tax=Limimaricola pyoseonensis TaxID=521013 RepID=A0A1G7E686_9RHOB|nr:L,D-transpeptidase [Limimaricola pyoseonensis]SDE58885.1 Lipoprotein-anchoring transpeptidase ErfK/SrfK [Limimaricola pyoseonensis]